MSVAPYLRTLARYNRWANRRLYDASAKLSDAQFREDKGAFFGSVQGTLNHLLVADRSWIARLAGKEPPPDTLSTILFERFADLRAAREAEDAGIIARVDGTPESRFSDILEYRRVSTPEPVRNAIADIWFHLFNHATHHRGQVHGLLTQFGQPSVELDLIYYVRLRDAGKVD